MLKNVTFSGNSASGIGGGMYNHGNPTLMNITFEDNSANEGGGMGNNNSFSSDTTLTNVTFSGNSAIYNGGGMYNSLKSGATLTNITFSGNWAAGGGGMGNDGSLTLTNVTFEGNAATNGGGMENGIGSPTIRTAIFWDNIATTAGAQIYNNSANTPVISDSVVQGGCPTGSSCVNIITTSPMLGLISNYGGFTQTIPLLTGSSAIDAGDDLVCPVADQRGIPRPQGAHCDIGAYEVDITPPTVVSSVRANSNPTSAASVDFTVTLSEVVNGVDAGDFSLTTSGVTGASISSVSGSGATRAVSVNTGSGNGTIRLDVRAGATINDVSGNSLTGLPYTGGQVYTVTKIVTLTSSGTQDGWVLESSENSNVGGTMNSGATTLNLGDDATKKQYRGILSFNTGGLPDNAVITGITLKVKQQAIVGSGNPVTTFQGFMVDIKNGTFGMEALQTGDFQVAASASYGPFNTALSGGWYSINLTTGKASINKLATNSGLTQIRLRFKLDDNNNTIANYLSLYSGNTTVAADRPQLIITYYVP